MICKRCGKEFFKDYRKDTKNKKRHEPLFCSRACSCSRQWSKEHKESLSKKMRVVPDVYCKTCKIKLSRNSKSPIFCRKCLGKEREGTGECGVSSKENSSKYTIVRRKIRRDFVIKHLGGKCNRCGYNKYDGALEIHHKNPKEKDFSFTTSNLLRKLSVLLKEIDKCVLLCANCHREEHEKMRKESLE